MMHKVVSLVMCLLLPGVVLAGGNPGAAMGNFAGDVALNGRSAPSSTAIFPGDKLVTGRNASAYIARPGLTMTVDSDSSAQLLAGGARVLSGSSVVTLKPGSVLEYDDLHISAASDSAKVQIVSRPGTQMVASLHGTLNVSDASTMITVPQGQALMAKALGPQNSVVEEIAGGSSSPPAGAVKKGISLKKWVIIGSTAAGAGAVAATAAVQSSNKNTNINNINVGPISPSAP